MNDNNRIIPEETIQNAEVTFANVTAEKDYYKEQWINVSTEYDQYKQHVESVINENEQLKIKLNTTNDEYTKLTNKASNLKAKNNDLLQRLSNEEKAKSELFIQYQQEKIELLEREKQLAEKESEFYRMRSENSSSVSANNVSTNVGSIPKVPEFNGSSIGFSRWINWVSDLFANYPRLTDFNRRIMVVDALKGEARSWYDAEPDENTVSWDALKDALLRQYGGTNSVTNALKTINTMKLNSRSDFNTFILRIRPAIQVVAKNDNVLAVALLRSQIDTEIKRFIPEIQNETFISFEQRLKLQCQEMFSKDPSYSASAQKTSMHSDAMDVGVISAPIQNYNRSRSPSNMRPHSPGAYGNRNTRPHNAANTTMPKAMFVEYVKNCICYGCGKRGHLRTMCPNANRKFKSYKSFNAVENVDGNIDKNVSNDAGNYLA